MANKKPNILVIWGDDIGITNLSCYSDGLMGYRTPNIDRIANEGMRFTDYYGEQSCTAGRAAFITGQSVFRSGLCKVGFPGADLGLRAEDPTIAELLKPLGYATGQFGKNHFGDKDEFLPTNHGFDEFFGNLYHLNAEEEPEHRDYPSDKDFPNFRKNFGPRRRDPQLCRWAHRGHRSLDQKAYGDGGRRISRQRRWTLLTVNIQPTNRFSSGSIPRWMHFRVRPPEKILGQSGRWQSEYHDTMIEHDKHVGALLDKLDELGITENTIVLYSTDNGVHMNTWPDGGMSPFRNEKNSNWEGAYRVPAVVRWPGKIKAGSVSNEIVSHMDWLPTFLAAAGEPNIAEKLKKGHTAGEKTFKVLSGRFQPPAIPDRPRVAKSSKFLLLFLDDGDLTGLRYDNWKIVFMEQRMAGTCAIWAEPFVPLRIPKIFNLRTDPFERADITSNTYWDWIIDHAFLLIPAQKYVSDFLATFKEFPPRQKSASFHHRPGYGQTRSGLE